MNEVLHEDTIDITPPAAHVHLKRIKVEPGSWEEAVGAVGEATEVYRVMVSNPDQAGKQLGIIFEYNQGWALAAKGHVMYEVPGFGEPFSHNDAAYWLDKMNHIVRNDSPKYHPESAANPGLLLQPETWNQG